MPVPSLLRRGLTLALCALLSGCGGGSGGLSEPAGLVRDLGLVSATLPSAVSASVTNPFDQPASVGLAPAAGSAFALAPGATPTAAGSADVLVPLVFAPRPSGPYAEDVAFTFTSAGTTVTLTVRLRVLVETVVWVATPATLDFGIVAPGASVELDCVLANLSALSPVTLNSVSVPGPEFELLQPTLPLAVPAGGGSFTVRVRYTPTAATPDAGSVALGVGDAGGPARVDVVGNSISREVLTDFGVVPFGPGGDTATFAVAVPAEAISLTVEALGVAGDQFGLGLLTGPGGAVYENETSTGPYVWFPGDEAFSTTVPNTDRASGQLVPGGGTYLFRVRRLAGASGSARVRALVEVRDVGAAATGRLDLNVWLATGLAVDAASAAADARLQEVLSRVDVILSGQGVRLGAIDYFDVADPELDRVTEAEIPALLRHSVAAPQVRLNLFFVLEAIGGGVVGVAGTISGPKANGTGVSGVVSVYEGFGPNTIGLVAAHEIGHFLALLHTVEQDGSHDRIDDTAECPATGTGSGVCTTTGGRYLMHWLALGGVDLSGGQGLVIRGHPLIAPEPPGIPKRGAGGRPPSPGLETGPDDGSDLPLFWCATCRARHRPGGR